MPQIVNWLIEDQVIISHIVGDISLDEIKRASEEISALIDTGTEKVHLFVDVKALGRFPFDLIGLRKTAVYLQNPKLGYIAVYGASRMAGNFAQMLISLSGVQARFVRDYAEALNYLAQHDPHLKAALEAGTLPTEA
jgi:hypothetical protein